MGKIKITIYYYAGNHKFFVIPEKWCRECDLMATVVDQAVKELGKEKFEVKTKSWLLNLIPALFKGVFHPPGLIINGKLYHQTTVPDKTKLRSYLKSLLTNSTY